MGVAGGAGETDVLVVGAGPTGLALALELAAWGIAVRVVDAAPDAVHESRALAVQARTLELLARHGVADRLVSAGDPATTLVLHGGRRESEVALFGSGLRDTAYPFVLFVSQAVTERVLLERLTEYGVRVERDSTLVRLDQDAGAVRCRLAVDDGDTATVRARYVVGCDGAHSAVRKSSRIAFPGTAFPQTFVLADLEADGLQARRIHAYLASEGVLFFFPLGSPATWRTLVMRPSGQGPSTIAALQRLTDRYTNGRVRLRDPVWLTDFTIHSRCADQFRRGRVLLAGDAAHIHSPAGAQGMNTGIQDAVNLGWKLALVCRGQARSTLLDTYQAERMPVARAVLRMTDRAFRIATSDNPLLKVLRPRLAPLALLLASHVPALRRAGFRRISELAVHYPDSPPSSGHAGRLRPGPRPGDRFPDVPITIAGRPTTVHAHLHATGFHLILCGPPAAWNEAPLRRLRERGPLLEVSHLTNRTGPADAWMTNGSTLSRLGARGESTTAYLVRPDGYLGLRAKGPTLRGVEAYLAALTA